jgi:hypothetical protein
MSDNSNATLSSHFSSFTDRFALAPLDGAGVLLDLLTGGVYELNAGAAQICMALARGEAEAAIVERLARSFGLSRATAVHDVRTVLAQLTQLAAETQVIRPPHLLTFEATADGFLMRYRGQAILRIDPSGRSLVYEADPGQIGIEPILLLRWAVPHLLALQHQPVLHGSAVQHGEGVLAFSGYTGAGKTTLARQFAAIGATLVSEDLLVISCEQDVPAVFVEGETVLHNWAAEQSPQLMGGGTVRIDADGLREAVRGATLPLHELLLVDRGRRSGAVIATQSLPPAEALVCLLEHGFGEVPHRKVWAELLETCRIIASASSIRRATLPQGLEALQAAARSYRSTTAS